MPSRGQTAEWIDHKLFIQSLNLYLQVQKSASYDWVKVVLN